MEDEVEKRGVDTPLDIAVTLLLKEVCDVNERVPMLAVISVKDMLIAVRLKGRVELIKFQLP